jgi:hypothetical protein
MYNTQRVSQYSSSNPYQYKDNGNVYDNNSMYNSSVRASRFSNRSQPVYSSVYSEKF